MRVHRIRLPAWRWSFFCLHISWAWSSKFSALIESRMISAEKLLDQEHTQVANRTTCQLLRSWCASATMMMMCNLIQFQVVVRGSQRQGVNFHLLLFVCLYILPYTHYKIITSGCEYLMLRKMLFCNPQKKVSRSSLRKWRTADGKILDLCPRHCKSVVINIGVIAWGMCLFGSLNFTNSLQPSWRYHSSTTSKSRAWRDSEVYACFYGSH